MVGQKINQKMNKEELRLEIIKMMEEGLIRQGPPGIQGIQGEQGIQGVDGRQGPPGKDGKDGAVGQPGRPGKDYVKPTRKRKVGEN